MPLLGMETFLNKFKIASDPLKIWIANKPGAPTKSTTHGGFDNDPDTMNEILRSVLGKKPQRPFSKQDSDY